MRFLASVIAVSLAYVVALVAASDHHPESPPTWRRRHHAQVANLDKQSIQEANVTTRSLERRFGPARYTFYDAGLGACGKVNSNSDFIVALNQAQWAGGSHCFKKITIKIGGKSTQAEITDLCPGCPWGGLDFSRGLFNFFASEDVGVLSGEWFFGG
ncbi:hypothetical protein CVT24_011066, partial [Panaeolus cyanescens]